MSFKGKDEDDEAVWNMTLELWCPDSAVTWHMTLQLLDQRNHVGCHQAVGVPWIKGLIPNRPHFWWRLNGWEANTLTHCHESSLCFGRRNVLWNAISGEHALNRQSHQASNCRCLLDLEFCVGTKCIQMHLHPWRIERKVPRQSAAVLESIPLDSVHPTWWHTFHCVFADSRRQSRQWIIHIRLRSWSHEAQKAAVKSGHYVLLPTSAMDLWITLWWCFSSFFFGMT